MMELVVVLFIVLLTTVIAFPLVQNVTKSMQLSSSTANVTGMIRSTRFAALAKGYPYQLVLNGATIQTLNDLTDPTGADGNFTAVGNPVPLSGSSAAPTLGANITLQFSPSGAVKLVSVANSKTTITPCGNIPTPPAVATCSVSLTIGNLTKTIAVTTYGNIQAN
jgi:hypothetical protein